MLFSEKIYTCTEIQDKHEVINNILENKPISNLYLICVTDNKNSIFEIFHINYISMFLSKNVKIIGMALKKKSAFNLVKEIFEDCIQNEVNIEKFKDVF